MRKKTEIESLTSVFTELQRFGPGRKDLPISGERGVGFCNFLLNGRWRIGSSVMDGVETE
jgi:hypothetical protein